MRFNSIWRKFLSNGWFNHQLALFHRPLNSWIRYLRYLRNQRNIWCLKIQPSTRIPLGFGITLQGQWSPIWRFKLCFSQKNTKNMFVFVWERIHLVSWICLFDDDSLQIVPWRIITIKLTTICENSFGTCSKHQRSKYSRIHSGVN